MRWMVRCFDVALLVFLAAVGCNSDKDSEDTAASPDADGDGWTVADGDCDDERYAVHPGLKERCNGRDDDCNGEIDEDWPDDDHDGVLDCYEGESCNGEDDNANDEVDEGWPDADGDGDADCIDVEDCDGLDNNGDGQIDEGFDADGDGASTCATVGLVDCDDADASLSPYTDEIAGTQIDEDCDGRIDEGDWVAGDLAITEIMYDPAYPDDDSGEWIEVLNLSGRDLVLNGLELLPNGGAPHMVASDDLIVLPAGEYFVFGIADYIRGVEPDYAYNDFVLSNVSDGLGLAMEDLLLDEVVWGTGTDKPEDEEGSSLAVDPAYATASLNDADSAWCLATEPYHGSEYALNNGSPGSENELCPQIDRDGDGFSETDGDCDDADITAWPGNTEVWYDGIDEDCDGASDYDIDGDGVDAKGYGGRDCDDNDATILPGAIDTWYDGIDSDCDGASDYDRDEDGYDYMMYGGDDCLDTNDDVNPGAVELCDGGKKDEDCDGLIDDEDDVVDDQTTYYLDADADGYGTPTSTIASCEAPEGYAATDDDCDDTSASIYPGASETWYDGVDGDCGTDSDYDADADGHDGSDWGGDDCDDADDGSYPGAPDVLGADENTCGVDPMLSELSSRVGDESSAYLGRSLGAAGDVDGDGVPDLLIGAQGADSSVATDAGVGLLVYGTADGSVDLGVEDATLNGQTNGDRTGQSLTGLRDWDGDGYDEIAIGAPYFNDTGADVGVAYIAMGPVSGTYDLAGADATVRGVSAADYAASALADLGDWDGDGVHELLIGAVGDDSGGSAAGSVFVISGGASGSGSVSTGALEMTGERASDAVGNALASADVDGDGVEDALIGASARSTTRTSAMGAAYLVLGPASGTLSLGSADAILYGSAASDAVGTGIAALGDTDGDGYADFVVGAPGFDGGASGAGAAWIFLGPVSGSATAESLASASLLGDTASAALGTGVAGPGDIDGDGNADLAAGAPGYKTYATNGGAVYLLTGPFSGTTNASDADDAKFASATSLTGFAVGGPGDLTGDGLGDVVVGAWGLATGASGGGGAYLLGVP